MNKLITKISDWHRDRKITINGNSLTQTVKLGEEFGELCSGIVRSNKDTIKDSIGDMVVVLIAIAELEGMTLDECVYKAWKDIEHRKGQLLSNGNFLKEDDYNCLNCKFYNEANSFCDKFKTVMEKDEKCLYFEGRK